MNAMQHFSVQDKMVFLRKKCTLNAIAYQTVLHTETFMYLFYCSLFVCLIVDVINFASLLEET